MTQTLNLLFKEIEGSWIYNQTFYCLINKVIKINKYKMNIIKLNSFENQKNFNKFDKNNYIYEYGKPQQGKVIYKYKDIKYSKNTSCFIERIDDPISIKYNMQLYEKNYLKINCKTEKINYSEYIYAINKNLRISFILVKKFNKCIAISFTSQIKINI
uniref:Chromophore lyase CpcS/CpeS n=1 Tax=Leiomenia cribrosa TaxID=217483 RepID=A0A4D6WXS9_9FLOR|nr:hypothetical protein [Leiomenia cribrosa]